MSNSIKKYIPKSIKKRVITFIYNYINPLRVRGKTKFFCIGRNKTGTTSLERSFLDFGYRVGSQERADIFLENYIKRDFQPIIKFCTTAQVFQDFPFSYPETYKFLDGAYPDSKFILSVRDSPEQWYNSIIKFQSKIYGNGKVPTADDLKKPKVWGQKGRPWKRNRAIYNTPENDLYNKDILIKSYNDYNRGVVDYFKDRPDDLLIINLAEEGAYQKFCKFLDVKSDRTDFPWENRTTNIK